MNINESWLKRTTSKDGQLQKKLLSTRKKRDSAADKLRRFSKKKKKINADIQRINRYTNEILKYDTEITEMTEKIMKNTKKMNEYKTKVTKEQEKQFQSMENNGNTNKEYLKKRTELSSKLNELSSDFKDAVEKKKIVEFDVFLSHSNLDKEEYVSELSDRLESKELKVFEDVKVFKIGQSQTDMMNMGILNSRFVVVFLSPNFIRSGWSDYEFKSFLNRKINEKESLFYQSGIMYHTKMCEIKTLI